MASAVISPIEKAEYLIQQLTAKIAELKQQGEIGKCKAGVLVGKSEEPIFTTTNQIVEHFENIGFQVRVVDIVGDVYVEVSWIN